MIGFDWFYVGLAVFAVLAAVFSLFVGAKSSPNTKKVLLVLWLIVPPVFFFVEYWLRRESLVAACDLERVKDMQQLASQIWAGVAAALGAIYFKGESPDAGADKGDA